VRYRKYTNKERKPEIDPLPPATKELLNLYEVTCRRQGGSPGRLVTQVRARSEEHAKEQVIKGEVPGVGLGWSPVKVVLLQPGG